MGEGWRAVRLLGVCLLILLAMPYATAVPETIRVKHDPENDEMTGVASFHPPADECHAAEADLVRGEVAVDGDNVIVTATLRSAPPAFEIYCLGLPFEAGMADYMITIGGPDAFSDRLSGRLTWTGDAWLSPCVHLTKEFEEDGRTRWQQARGCFGTMELHGNQVVLTGAMRGSADFGNDFFPNVQPYSISPHAWTDAVSRVWRGHLVITDYM